VELTIEERKAALASNSFNPLIDANEETLLHFAQVYAESCIVTYRAVLTNTTRNAMYFDKPLVFWRMMESMDGFGTLCHLARMYLTIQATSAESERLFSKAGMVYTARRSRLSDNNFCSVIFCNSLEKTLCQAYNT
jgi:hypothetical protein